MKYLLDANTCILLLAGHPHVMARTARCDAGDVAVSAIALAEVALGSQNGKHPPIDVLDSFLENVATLPFDLAAARNYAQLTFRRGSFDRLIAAHALARNLTLVTANVCDFADVPDLRVEDWTA